MERTLSIIKPDATTRNITGKVNAMIEDAGLKIIAQKRILLSKEQAEEFYGEHKGKVFFPSLVEIMTSAPVVVQVLEAEDAVARYRKIMGATNPAVAEEGTIRKTFALSIDKNTVHGSDSLESAEREISFFFSRIEIFG
ncbi:MAG: nucleoside-diphosphate kinase [Alphaproteobacteria bacterium]|nr:nucleoside-diphosphate kinase [Alphaproteobacteria bacterium]MBQ8631859.1 nucleoside-diphosphate kinase [Alphaproteobacteria bacterium]MDY4840876.1 nucleoside-diphosphate kinase [Alphaproteobacteria bacterium]